MPYAGEDVRDRLYRLYRATFKALAVAGNAQFSILGEEEDAEATLSALRADER